MRTIKLKVDGGWTDRIKVGKYDNFKNLSTKVEVQ